MSQTPQTHTTPHPTASYLYAAFNAGILRFCIDLTQTVYIARSHEHTHAQGTGTDPRVTLGACSTCVYSSNRGERIKLCIRTIDCCVYYHINHTHTQINQRLSRRARTGQTQTNQSIKYQISDHTDYSYLWWSVWNACLRTSRGMWCL